MKESSIKELQILMESGELSSKQLVDIYLQKIEEIDKGGPKINSIIEINPDVIDIANNLDEERKNGNVRGLLHGIPILIKENINTADQMMTTAGSSALKGNYASKDAFLIKNLREAGAIILGKTNLSEWANFRSTKSVSGWSSRGGQTRNPYALDRNPCGSSSGSAVAVTSNLCSVAVGTETDGSIVCPSQTNSIVGIKPTLGLVSRTGIIPVAHSQDTAGPMARTVEDAAILLSFLVGQDSFDSITQNDVTDSFIDYTNFLDKNGLKNSKIGVARKYFDFHPKVDKIMEEAILVMKNNGAKIIDPVEIELPEDLDDSEYEVLLYEFKHDLNKYLEKVRPEVSVHSLKDIIEYNKNNAEIMMPYFNQEEMEKAQEKGSITDENYLKALEKIHTASRKEGIDKILTDYKLDAIIAPTGGPAWLIDWVTGDYHGGGSSSLAAMSGYPIITVPAGYVFGLPVGISFFSGAFSEPILLKLAYSFEQATKVRKPPQFLSSVVFSKKSKKESE
ncbi:MAG: Glutamyl-tRNA(Gln) amidotransferase subunit A [Candidatus Heimdallarchaeota archaeon LC_3]|nr:MAG: Glutamyl-tRNA(Gln) amidotransferase subunit A [Candidatus Heimdallarchaeota archaeon LC_3]